MFDFKGIAGVCHRLVGGGFHRKWDAPCSNGFRARQEPHRALMKRPSGTRRVLEVIFAVWIASFADGRAEDSDVRRDATVQAIERVLPSVVNISTTTVVPVQDPFREMFDNFFGRYHNEPRRRSRESYSLGSGLIIDEAGYILTNDHVVRRADKIAVLVGTNVVEARVVGTSDGRDVALLKIDPPNHTRLVPARFARDDDVFLGETVIALGNPFGLGGSVSRGILSSKNRRPPAEKGPLDVQDWLQTDAAINPGNSGGPLINVRGEVIGINVAVFREQNAEGIGFAIPIKRVSEALSEMFTPESVKQLWFGAKLKAGSLPLTVTKVQAGSPAERAGLKSGDQILQLNGRAPRGFIEFNEMLIASGKSESRLMIQRSGDRREIIVRMAPEKDFFNSSLVRKKLGMSVQELTPELADKLDLQPVRGLVISGVDRDSPAAGKLQPRFVITAADGDSVSSVTELAKILYGKKSGESVMLDIYFQQVLGNFYRPMEGRIELELK
jgi:serine protease Do